ncbi:hypothetical protein SAY86_030198 [Trapa natans]|uniref:Uncharacterized protein n=1 Tax=Trapa natans TaxID=22666 RepID=A0AAN7MFP5_TRANT|nr:hypothetical protein SAY86_030198 [Trapa natans]
MDALHITDDAVWIFVFYPIHLPVFLDQLCLMLLKEPERGITLRSQSSVPTPSCRVVLTT